MFICLLAKQIYYYSKVSFFLKYSSLQYMECFKWLIGNNCSYRFNFWTVSFTYSKSYIWILTFHLPLPLSTSSCFTVPLYLFLFLSLSFFLPDLCVWAEKLTRHHWLSQSGDWNLSKMVLSLSLSLSIYLLPSFTLCLSLLFSHQTSHLVASQKEDSDKKSSGLQTSRMRRSIWRMPGSRSSSSFKPFGSPNSSREKIYRRYLNKTSFKTMLLKILQSTPAFMSEEINSCFKLEGIWVNFQVKEC